MDPPSCHLDHDSVLHSGVPRIGLVFFLYLFSLPDHLLVLEDCYGISS